jgi:hypothetical protein
LEQGDREEGKWVDGEFGNAEGYYLVADGLASCSVPARSRLPKNWLYDLRTNLDHKTFGSLSKGFSYLEYGCHYAPADTSISFEETDVSELTTPYLSQSNTSVVCVTFSLAGPLFILGIASAIAKEATAGETQGETQLQAIKELILVQPAIRVRDIITRGVAAFVEERKGNQKLIAVPLSIQSLMDSADAMEDRIKDALALIRQHGIPVTMLYWKGDYFLEYSDDLRQLANDLGIICTEVVIPPNETLGPFQMHREVARSDEIGKALIQLLHTF